MEERFQPDRFKRLGAEATPPYTILGEPRLLDGQTLALLCSARCPGGPILRALDLARELRDADLTVVGGFHSPVEQDCLTLLLRGTARLVVCPARDISEMRVPAAWRSALAAERLALALLAAGRTVLTPADPANAALIARGAVAVESWAEYEAGRAEAEGG